MKVINRITMVVLALAISLTGFSNDEEFKKEWHQTYTINPDANFKLTNKFGDVNITTWDQNTIQVDVVITVDMKSENKAKEALEKINIKDVSSASSVELTTDFGKVKGGEHSNMKVDYTIKLPKSARLGLRNDFGDLFVASMEAPANIHVEYGSFRSENLAGGSNELILKFSAGELDGFGGGKIEVEYGSVSLDDGGSIEITSAFSALDFDNAEELKINSQYDAFDIDHVANLILDAKFSTTEIDELTKSLKADLGYGGIEVDKVSKDFGSIDVESEFGGVELSFEDGASYTLNATTNMGDIDYPKAMKITNESNEILTKEVSGTTGSSPENRTVKLKVEHGEIKIE